MKREVNSSVIRGNYLSSLKHLSLWEEVRVTNSALPKHVKSSCLWFFTSTQKRKTYIDQCQRSIYVQTRPSPTTLPLYLCTDTLCKRIFLYIFLLIFSRKCYPDDHLKDICLKKNISLVALLTAVTDGKA